MHEGYPCKGENRGGTGVDAGVKMGTKKRAIATNCYSPLGCHYLQDIMRVLKKTLSQRVNIFFKMNTLSAERCPFFAWILTSKKSIFATFSAHFSPHASPRSFSLSEGILRTRHPPSKSLAFPPFIFPFRGQPSQANSQAKPTGRVSVKTLCFLQKSHTFYCKFQLVLA